jgi:hypothetical protein
MEQSPSWEATCFSGSQGFTAFYGTRRSLRKSLLPVFIKSQINPFDVPILCLRPTLLLSPISAYVFPVVSHHSCPSYMPLFRWSWFVHPIVTCCGVQIVKGTVQSPALLLPRPSYTHICTLASYSQSLSICMFPFVGETKFNTRSNTTCEMILVVLRILTFVLFWIATW